MPERERMSSVDTAWLRMDRATNRMVIVGVLLFDTPLDYRRLKTTLTRRLLRFQRFRMRPVLEAGGAYWEQTPRFSLDAHLHRVKLTGNRGPRELEKLVAQLMPRPFDPRRPHWDFHLVENYARGAALVVRVHHSYADGIALVGVMLSLTDETSAASSRDATAQPNNKSGEHGLIEQLFGCYMDLVRHPDKLVDYARIAASVAAEAAELAAMPDDSRTRFKGKAAVDKRVAWAAPIPLDEVKAVGNALGCSVNDVMLACAAGALGRYLREHGDTVADIEIRAMVPVNLRPPEQFAQLGNRFGLVTLLLPLGIANPLSRVQVVRERMEALKDSYQAALAFALLGLAGVCPKPIQQKMLDVLANKATAVITNVPGPQKPLYLAGARIADLMFWVPQSGDIGMGVSILSYNGGVQFGVVTDAGLVPDPARIVAHFTPEFERLLLAVLMEPWEAPRDPALVENELADTMRRHADNNRRHPRKRGLHPGESGRHPGESRGPVQR